MFPSPSVTMSPNPDAATCTVGPSDSAGGAAVVGAAAGEGAAVVGVGAGASVAAGAGRSAGTSSSPHAAATRAKAAATSRIFLDMGGSFDELWALDWAIRKDPGDGSPIAAPTGCAISLRSRLATSDTWFVEKTSALRVAIRRARAAVVATLVLVVAALPQPALADISRGEMVSYPMVFPVDGDHYFSDTFGAPRSHGRRHQGQDIMATKGTPVVAAASGTVRYVNWTARSHLNPDRCCSIVVGHDDGWETRYLHLNNDTEGTDDGRAWGIADGIVPGALVEAGQLLGWAGDSGNAEKTPSHLHFELINPDGVYTNPFESLLLAGGNPPPASWSVASDPLLASSGVVRVGDRGENVERLQIILSDLGYAVGAIDGIFGPVTAAAVIEFQSNLGVAPDGFFGPVTKSAVVEALAPATDVLGLGSNGPDVEVAQKLLAALGFDPGPTDGIFGSRTMTAVLAVQRQLGLEVDGLVGPQTWSVLGIR